MSTREKYRDQPDPEPEPYHELAPARCPECGIILRRVSLDEHRCPEHGIVRPWYGKPERDAGEFFRTDERRGLSDMRRDLGRAPTAQEWQDERR